MGGAEEGTGEHEGDVAVVVLAVEEGFYGEDGVDGWLCYVTADVAESSAFKKNAVGEKV